MELYQKEVNVTVRRQVVFVLFPVFKTVWQLPVRDDKFGWFSEADSTPSHVIPWWLELLKEGYY